MTQIYATVGDTIEEQLNKKGETEYRTVEGTRVIDDVYINDDFETTYGAIKYLWPCAVIRFKRDGK